MNGVFKFKENIFLKYKKEILLTAGAVLTLATVVKFVPDHQNMDGPNGQGASADGQVAVEEVVESNGFNVVLGDQVIGVVRSSDDSQEALNLSLEMLIETLGYNPEMDPGLVLEDNYSLDETYLNTEALATTIKDYVIDNLDEVKTKAYVMKIGDDFTVALSSTEEIEEVLKNAQDIYVNSEEFVLDITLNSDSHNGMVMTPQVTMVKEDALADEQERSFTAAGASEDDLAEVAEIEASDESIEETVENDARTDGTTVSVNFAENVLVVESYVSEDEIHDVASATELITKENDEPKIYKVVSGDVPSIIAESNNMTTQQLYELNPGLKENATRIQIGDELIVMVPEPELSVSTDEKVVYTETIYKGTTYVENPEKYEGSESVVDNGYNGVMQITAIVSKVNGSEVDREVVDKTVVEEAKDRVISKGTKPLPTKGATGNFIAPLSSYRVTSPFGYRWGGFHYGIDLATPTGTPVMASDGGTVTIAGWYGNYGYLVEIKHSNGVRTRYGHNSKVLVSVGQQVSQYEVIAKSGNTGRSTGPHVHFEIRFDGVCANPADYVDF